MVTPQYKRIVGGASTSVTLSGLEPGTTYRIRVWSTDGTSVSREAGRGIWQQWKVVRCQWNVKTANLTTCYIQLYTVVAPWSTGTVLRE